MESYEKKYKAALEWMRDVYPTLTGASKEDAEHFFPELAESEDEKIRAEIVEFLLDGIWNTTEISRVKESQRYAKWIAYLEKQKEQKPIDDKDAIEPTPKQDYSGLTDFERAIHRGFLCAGVENVPVEIIKETAQDCLAQIKPTEWSEEDRILIEHIIEIIQDYAIETGQIDEGSGGIKEPLISYLCFLCSLRPQLHWKPSENQMDALEYFVQKHKAEANAATGIWPDYENLVSLRNDLKKL